MLDFSHPYTGRTILHDIAALSTRSNIRPNAVKVAKFLLDDRLCSILDRSRFCKETILHLACLHGNNALVSMLLTDNAQHAELIGSTRHGSVFLMRDEHGMTPLMMAITAQSVDCVMMLWDTWLKAGGSIEDLLLVADKYALLRSLSPVNRYPLSTD